MALPDYELIDASGEQHRRRFTVRCNIEGIDVTTTGEGTSLRNAEQEAAGIMFARLTDEANT